MKFWIFITAILLNYGCGSSNSGGSSDSAAATSTITAKNVLGRWSASEVKSNDQSVTMSGKMILELQDGGKYVSVGQDLSFNGSTACWYVEEGTYTTDESKSQVTLTKTIENGPKGCTDDDFNPKVYSAAIDQGSTLRMTGDDKSVITSTKLEAASPLSYQTLLEKMEKVTISVSDPDQSKALSLIYRNPKQGGWVNLCPRLAGVDTSGFETTPTFTYENNIYETWLQWSEGEIDPANYNGATPGFSFQKRSSQSSDSVGYTGTGLYSCSGTTECENKCTLTVSKYSLTEKAATLEISCTDLTAHSSDDSDNLFGTSLSNFKMTVTCDYTPDFL